MTNFPAIDRPWDQPPPDVPKLRHCLRCNATFPSQWSGERVCSRCKSSNAWRSGAPLTSRPSSIRR
jgi:ribosomal protein L40E